MSQGEHLGLCQLGAKWLRRQGCTVVLVDPQTTRCEEQPDVIGWRYGFWSLLIEVKCSRADFLADQKKPHRQPGVAAMGQERWYLAPVGILGPEDVPKGWGLLLVEGERVKEVVKAPRPKGFRGSATMSKEALVQEVPLLIAQLERVMAGRPTHLLPQGAPSTRQKRAERRKAAKARREGLV